jgi:hypothetical protein
MVSAGWRRERDFELYRLKVAGLVLRDTAFARVEGCGGDLLVDFVV